MLVALVGINVYVFFFNRGTAPREILNMQSTSKTFESTRQEALAADVRKAAGELVASSSGAKPRRRAGRPRRPRTQPSVAAARRHPVAPRRGPHPVRAAARDRSRCARPAARAPAHQGPVRAPARGRRRDADAQAGRREDSSAPTTRWARCWRAKGSAPPARNVIAALTKLVDPRSIRGGAEIRRPRRRRRHAGGVRVRAHARAALPGRARRRRRGRARQWTARKQEAGRDQDREAGGTVESSLYESVQKAGESTGAGEPLVDLFAWDINFYTDTHPGDTGRSWSRSSTWATSSTSTALLAAEYGGKIGTFRGFYWAGKDAPARARASTTTTRRRPWPRACSRRRCASCASARSSTASASIPSCTSRRAPGHRLRGAHRHAGVGVDGGRVVEAG